MGLQKIIVTGGNGLLGERILGELSDCGYETVNISRGKRREEVSTEYIRADLLDAGNVYGALAESSANAIIHVGTIPAPGGNPGYEVYESNVMSTYHVLEASKALGLEKACIASSINAMGCAYQDEPMEVHYLPVDEEHPVTPRDPYAMSKQAVEVMCDGFGRQNAAPLTISTIRYPWIAKPKELSTQFSEADRTLQGVDSAEVGGRDELFSYIHIRDAARIARKAIEANFTGHERFWAAGRDTTLCAPSKKVVRQFFPDAIQKDPLPGHRSLIDIQKASELLDWEPRYSWRAE